MTVSAKTRPAPRFGRLKGKIWMAPDWDQWSEEELAAFEAPIDPYERGDGVPLSGYGGDTTSSPANSANTSS